jgi:hypothetical protein
MVRVGFCEIHKRAMHFYDGRWHCFDCDWNAEVRR